MLQRLPVDLTVPSAPALSYVLRHREHWPKGFKFDYHTSCAIDLVYELWHVHVAATAFGMPVREVYRIFICGSTWSGVPYSSITPEMVANQIDLYLAQQAEESQCPSFPQ